MRIGSKNYTTLLDEDYENRKYFNTFARRDESGSYETRLYILSARLVLVLILVLQLLITNTDNNVYARYNTYQIVMQVLTFCKTVV